jgi:hypothetical protein
VNAIPKAVRNLVPTLPSDDDLELRLEVESLQARGALLQMLMDVVSPLLSQFAVQIVVQRVDGFLTI